MYFNGELFRQTFPKQAEQRFRRPRSYTLSFQRPAGVGPEILQQLAELVEQFTAERPGNAAQNEYQQTNLSKRI